MSTRFLVLQTAFLGDVLLTTPVFRTIKETLPDTQLAALVIPAMEGVLRTNPFVDEVIVYDKRGMDRGPGGMWNIIQTVRQRKFDVAVVPHRSVRSAGIVWCSGIPVRIGFDRSAAAFLLTDVVRYRSEMHEICRNLSLLHPLGLRPDPKGPEVFPTEDDRTYAREVMRAAGIADSERPIAIAPGSAWPTKRWPPEGFAEVADRAVAGGAKVVLVGGRDDKGLCEGIVARMTRPAATAAGVMSVRQSAALLSRCAVLVSNDSAAAHLSSAVGTPVVAIFGPTVPSLGFTPYGPGHVIVEEDVPCRPCGAHGGKTCRRGHFACMRALSAERVFEEMRRAMRQ